LTNRDPLIFYQHMLDHAREAMALVQGKTRTDLYSDRLLNLALVRLLEIIGEATNRIPEKEQARHPEIPWPQIVSLRKKLARLESTLVPNEDELPGSAPGFHLPRVFLE
jgi:uncharacterized protein with HEPN domain